MLGDLQGPRIRIGALQQPVPVEPGQDVTLVPEGEGADLAGGELPITYEALADDVDPDTVVAGVLRAVRVPEVVLQGR